MSLDKLLKTSSKSASSGIAVADIELYLPPEFNIDFDKWRDLFVNYNRLGRTTKTANAIQQYIREKNPGVSTNDLFTISEVVERDGRFLTTATFNKNKAGLTALYIYNAEEHVRLLPITQADGSGQIVHVVLSYVPE